MSSGDHGATRVATGIYRRQGGTYSAVVSVNWVEHNRSFPTFEEAKAWRDELVASRPKRDSRRGVPDRSADSTAETRTIREVLAAAPRTEIERDGRIFTVVRLPDAIRMEAA